MEERKKKTSFKTTDLDAKPSSIRSGSPSKFSDKGSKLAVKQVMSKRNSLPAAAFRRTSHLVPPHGTKPSPTSDIGKNSKADSFERRPSNFRRDSRLELSQYRRKSVWERLTESYRGSDRHTNSSSVTRPSGIRYQNTYILDPPEGQKKFNPSKVEPIMSSILDSILNDETYDPKKCHHLVMLISDTIRDRLKGLEGLKRYRYICWVAITESAGQSMEIGSRCLWAPEVDNEVSVTYVSPHLKAVATVFAVYLE